MIQFLLLYWSPSSFCSWAYGLKSLLPVSVTVSSDILWPCCGTTWSNRQRLGHFLVRMKMVACLHKNDCLEECSHVGGALAMLIRKITVVIITIARFKTSMVGGKTAVCFIHDHSLLHEFKQKWSNPVLWFDLPIGGKMGNRSSWHHISSKNDMDRQIILSTIRRKGRILNNEHRAFISYHMNLILHFQADEVLWSCTFSLMVCWSEQTLTTEKAVVSVEFILFL